MIQSLQQLQCPGKHQYITESIPDDVIQAIRKESIVGCDTETTGLDPHKDRLRLLQIAVPGTVYVFDFFKLSKDEIRKLEGIFKGKLSVILHNGIFDCQFLWKHDIDLSDANFIFDTMLASQIVHNGLALKHSLAAVVERELGQELSKEQQASDWSKADLSPEQLEYAALDVEILFPLREKLFLELIYYELIEIAKIEFQNVWTLAALEYNGIYIDIDLWESNLPEYEAKIEELEKEILHNLPGVFVQPSFGRKSDKYSASINSPKQLLLKLQELGIPTESTSEGELKLLDSEQYPILELIDKYRKTCKLVGTYIKPYRQFINPVTNRIHPNIYQLGAYTGRIAATNPAILTIPRSNNFRRCFKGQGDNYYLDHDYSQIESRLTAVEAGEQKMLQIFNNDLDIYVATAADENSLTIEEFHALESSIKKVMRQGAKSEVLGLGFGMGALRYRNYCKEVFGIHKTLEEAKKQRNTFLYRTYPGLSEWHKKCTHNYEQKTQLTNRTGRLFRGKITYNNAINYGVQSLATDIMKAALNNIYSHLKESYGVPPLFDRSPVFPVAYIHDQCTLEGEKAALEKEKEIIEKIMIETAEQMIDYQVRIKVDGSIGKDWAESH
jgi:DNA polymerase I-like protein with 3'-5' exonuclease and polymerase domains